MEEELEYWLSYINNWEASHNGPVADKPQQLPNNATLTFEDQSSDKKQDFLLINDKHSIH